MKKKFLISLIALRFLVLNTVQAQIPDSTFTKYAEQFLYEKTYLHYDKDAYLPGETVWFKGYLMEGIAPANDSKTLYVDWIGENGVVLSHGVSPLVSSVTNGQFTIPENYTGSVLHVRSYTKWMLNFDTAFVYSKDLRIISKTTANTKIVSSCTVSKRSVFPGRW
jgi:uncharacterized protein YfaS (alpha-2-macroglobulin family)